MGPYQAFEESLSGRCVSASLEKHIDHLAILVDRSPQILLLAADLHEDFINEESIAESLMRPLQPPGVLWSELVTPQSNGFVAYGNTPFSKHVFNITLTEIESKIKPDRVLDDLGREPMTFVRTTLSVHSIIVA